MKKLFRHTSILLFVWFTLDMTGLTIFGQKIVESALLSIDGVFWIIFALLFYMFIKGVRKSEIYLTVLFVLWALLQYMMTISFIIFPNKVKINSYNDYFKDMFYIIQPREDILIPDFYHIVLFVLIFINAIIGIFTVVEYFKNNKNSI